MTHYGADQIVELEFLEAIRRRPGMYIGNNNQHGLHHLLLEVIDNSVDECMAGDASKIRVVIEKNGAVLVDDDGRGIPVDYKPESGMSALTQVMIKPHAGGKFGGEDSAYSSSGGLHGIGLKCTNAFSTYLEVFVSRHGLIFHQRFENGGIPVTGVEIYDATKSKKGEINEETEIILDKKGIAKEIRSGTKLIKVEANPDLKSGTKIKFLPNRTWFAREMAWNDPSHNVPWDFNRLDTRFRQIAHLYPGVKIEFIDKRETEPQNRIYLSKNGLLDYIEFLNEDSEPLHKPVIFKEKSEIETEEGKATIETEVVFQYAGEETQIYSFVNAIPTPLGGTHVSAFKAGLTRAVKQFASQKKIIKEEEDFKGDDVLLGLTAVIKITMTNTPQFLSQTKESLTSPEVHGPIFSATYNHISSYLEKNGIGRIIANQAVAAARGREAAAQARRLIIKRSAMEAGEFVLGKLADVQRRSGKPVVPMEHTALYLVEGDSAGGSCKQGRDSRYHAILPLRGKIPNVEKMKLNDILKNNEIASIIAAIGTGVGSDCNLESMRYGRAVVLVDADVDGSHIATLIATLFWRTMRPIIEAGRFFIARPPLYLIRNNKKKEARYAFSDEERDDLLSLWKNDDSIIQRYKGLGEMNPEQLRETVFLLPDFGQKKPRQNVPHLPFEQELNAAHFSNQDIQIHIDDVHRTRSLIEQLMGTDAGKRKNWIMNVDWNEED